MAKTQTLEELVDALADLDGYIAKGGRLLDLETVDWSRQPPMVQATLYERLGPETCARLGRSYARVGAGLAGDATVKEALTEKDVRALWRASADASGEED